jgi:hypothetical protein
VSEISPFPQPTLRATLEKIPVTDKVSLSQSLTDDQLDHLLNFVGYGTLDADVWFFGMEEAGGGEANIRTRLRFQTVEDCAEAHAMLGVRKLHWGRRVIQRTWRGMCHIMLRLEGREPTRENIRDYQADHLGRSHGRTLLTELMPIPKPAVSQWGYEELIPQFASRDDYYRQVRPRRIRYLQRLLSEHRPRVVVGYGKAFWPAYRELFDSFRFSDSGPFQVASRDETLVILTGHFTARSMNGRLDDVVEIIQAHR